MKVQRTTRWRNFRGTLVPAGWVVVGLGATQALCALVGFALVALQFQDPRIPNARCLPDAWILLLSAAITATAGWCAQRYGRGHGSSNLRRREAMLAVVQIWLFAGFFGGLPFALASGFTPVDAFFESVSGLTTTGATIVSQIEGHLSAPILLWRSVIQWLGGMGIVVLFVAVFPSLGAGAKHMFKGEVPGTSAEGLKPRIAETSFTLWKLYASFTFLVALLLWLCGLSVFEAICHALTTMSTGGFSTRDASIAGFDSPLIELTLATFMVLGSVNYGLYYALLRGRSWKQVFRSTEFRVFLFLVLSFSLAIGAGITATHDGDFLTAFRYAYFTVATTISSTGFGVDTYMNYPSPVLGLLLFLMFVGGCSGSTAGGIKIERVVLLAKLSWAEFRKSFRPAVVHVIRMGKRAVASDVLSDVAVFIGVYIGCLGAGVLLIAFFDNTTLPQAFGATLSCLSNMGPAPFHEGADNFAAYGEASKLLFCLLMLLGRLEFFTLFALLVPDFWKR